VNLALKRLTEACKKNQSKRSSFTDGRRAIQHTHVHI